MAMSVRKMLTLIASCRLDPPASRTAFRFWRICRYHPMLVITCYRMDGWTAYRSVLDTPRNQFASAGICPDLPGAVDHVADDEALGQEGRREGSPLCADCDACCFGHCNCNCGCGCGCVWGKGESVEVGFEGTRWGRTPDPPAVSGKVAQRLYVDY